MNVKNSRPRLGLSHFLIIISLISQVHHNDNVIGLSATPNQYRNKHIGHNKYCLLNFADILTL